jgi:hypothetical protein
MEAGALAAELLSSLDGLLGAADDRELAAALVEVERLARAVEAAAVAIVDDADRRNLFLVDGHRSVRGWVKATVRASDAEVTQRVRSAKLVRSCPQVGDLLAQGRVGVAQVRELARARANPRCGEAIAEALDELVDSALNDDYETFAAAVRDWERLADTDGAHRGTEAAHEGRRVSLVAAGDTVYLEGRFGAVQGEAMQAILAAFAEAEFAADWDDVRRRFGDEACPAHMARTDAQRRADALFAILLAAAGAPRDGKTPEPLVHIVVDQATFEEQVANLVDPFHLYRNPGTGATPAGGPSSLEPPDPGRVTRMCRTASGLPVDPLDAVIAAFVGQVRRVVIGADGLVIDLGRRSRCFTGGAREAAVVQAWLDRLGRCLWPGCRLAHCQIDHTVTWFDQGATVPANAGPACGHHNRFKTRGYTTRRDQHGRWHTYRPDGTEIAAA